jgi:hypothetical protein
MNNISKIKRISIFFVFYNLIIILFCSCAMRSAGEKRKFVDFKIYVGYNNRTCWSAGSLASILGAQNDNAFSLCHSPFKSNSWTHIGDTVHLYTIYRLASFKKTFYYEKPEFCNIFSCDKAVYMYDFPFLIYDVHDEINNTRSILAMDHNEIFNDTANYKIAEYLRSLGFE